MTIRSQTISVDVSGSAGSATGSNKGQEPINGRVVGFYVTYTSQPETCTVTITGDNSLPISTISNQNQNRWYYPEASKTDISVTKFGANFDIDSGTVPEDIWTGGGLYPFPTASSTLSVVSSSTEDASGGTGATKIRIFGLDDNYDQINETVTLTGTTPVVTSQSFYRVNRMYIIGTVGSNGANVGNITVTHTPAGVISRIDANEGQTLQAVYTVPRDYYGHIQRIAVTVQGNAAATLGVDLYRRVNLGADASGWRVQRFGTATGSTQYNVLLANRGSGVSGGDDLRLTVDTSTANNVVVTGSFDLYLVSYGQPDNYEYTTQPMIDGYVNVAVSGGNSGSVSVVMMVES